jgi:hypothetical protein
MMEGISYTTMLRQALIGSSTHLLGSLAINICSSSAQRNQEEAFFLQLPEAASST